MPNTDVNGLNLKQVRAAIGLAEANLDAVKPECRPDLETRLAALRERARRLKTTEAHITRASRSLRRNR